MAEYDVFMTRASLHHGLLSLIVLAAIIPFFAYAQTDLEAQLRTMLSESAAQEGISGAELDLLVAELSNKAAEEGVTTENISDAVSAPVVVSPVTSGLPTVAERSSFALTGGYLTIFTIVGLLVLGVILVAVWRKIEDHDPSPTVPQSPVQPQI